MRRRPLSDTARGIGATRVLRTVDAPLLLLSGISLISSLGIAVMLPILPLYGVSLGATPFQLGLLTSAFAATNAAAQLGAGVLSDRWSPRTFILGGTAAYAGANALIATATSAVSLIAYRSLAGLGGGANIVATRLYLAQITQPERAAFANGVLSAAYSIGQVVGPAIGGIVTALSDLRMPFVLVAVTSSLAFLGAFWLRRVPPPTTLTAGQADAVRAPLQTLLVLFAAQFLVQAGFGGFITTYAPLATQVLGWSTAEVGIVFSFFGVGAVLLGPWLSHLADRVGRRRVGALSTIPVVLFGLVLAAGAPRAVLYVVTVLAGGGLTAFTAAWFALLTAASPGARRGRVFGLVNAGANLGIIAGAMVASTIWEVSGLPLAVVSASGWVGLAGIALSFLSLPPNHLTRSS